MFQDMGTFNDYLDDSSDSQEDIPSKSKKLKDQLEAFKQDGGIRKFAKYVLCVKAKNLNRDEQGETIKELDGKTLEQGKIYFDKDDQDETKLCYEFLNSNKKTKASGLLDVCVKGDLTQEFLDKNESQILTKLKSILNEETIDRESVKLSFMSHWLGVNLLYHPNVRFAYSNLRKKLGKESFNGERIKFVNQENLESTQIWFKKVCNELQTTISAESTIKIDTNDEQLLLGKNLRLFLKTTRQLLDSVILKHALQTVNDSDDTTSLYAKNAPSASSSELKKKRAQLEKNVEFQYVGKYIAEKVLSDIPKNTDVRPWKKLFLKHIIELGIAYLKDENDPTKRTLQFKSDHEEDEESVSTETTFSLLDCFKSPDTTSKKIIRELFIFSFRKNMGALHLERPTLSIKDTFTWANGPQFLANIRLSNRSIRRHTRNLFQEETVRERVRAVNSADPSSVLYTYSASWKANSLQGYLCVEAQNIKTKFIYDDLCLQGLDRDHFVLTGGAYSNVKPETLDVRKIRKWVVSGSLATEQPKNTKDIISFAYLFLGLESTRNPALFVLHQMALDLIQDKVIQHGTNGFIKKEKKQKTEKDSMSQEENSMLPGELDGSLGKFVKLHKFYRLYMPFPFFFSGSKIDKEGDVQSTSVNEKIKLIQKEAGLFKQWLEWKQTKEEQDNIDIDNTESLQKLIERQLCTWYEFPITSQEVQAQRGSSNVTEIDPVSSPEGPLHSIQDIGKALPDVTTKSPMLLSSDAQKATGLKTIQNNEALTIQGASYTNDGASKQKKMSGN